MGQTRQKLQRGEPALGGWIMMAHPSMAELMAGEGFDWICVDLEHTSTDYRDFLNIAAAVKGTGCDLLARLQANDPVQAKRVLDAGANGIIVPCVNSAEEARQVVSMAKFPPEGFRGVSFSRAADYGRNFRPYFDAHNQSVIVAVMIEHIDGVNQVDEILSTPGIDAAFIGPYDLSASMGLPGELDHPDVQAAQRRILEACQKHGVSPGLHVVAVDPDAVQTRIAEGYRFIACSLDTEFILHGCRAMLKAAEGS